MDELASRHLDALRSVHELLVREGIDYWLFGGWAVDFHAGRITRPHDDIDIAVWLDDVPAIAALLRDGGWTHAPDPEANGGTRYERDPVRLEPTFLVRHDGRICIAMNEGPVRWSDELFGDDVRTLHGVEARVAALGPLRDGKSFPRDSTDDAAKDRADHRVLSDLG